MKKAIKEIPKKRSSSNKKNSRPFTSEKDGYKETVYNTEEEKTYEKSDIAKNNKRNTSGPKS
jgi:hypothetical protein